MDCFCKGTVVGLVTGMVAGAIIVSKNKNLSNMIKEKSDIAGKKISKFASKVKECFTKNEINETCHEIKHQIEKDSLKEHCQQGQCTENTNGCNC